MSERLSLTVTSPGQSFTEPITLAEVKISLRIPDADDRKDDLLSAYIVAARSVAELRQGRDLVSKQWDYTLDWLYCDTIRLRENVSSVDLFQYTDSDGVDTALVDGTGYILDTSDFKVMPPYGEAWPSFTPWPSSAVLIRYTVTPRNIRPEVYQGMKFLISQWYTNNVPVTEGGFSSVIQYPFALQLLDFGRVPRA